MSSASHRLAEPRAARGQSTGSRGKYFPGLDSQNRSRLLEYYTYRSARAEPAAALSVSRVT